MRGRPLVGILSHSISSFQVRWLGLRLYSAAGLGWHLVALQGPIYCVTLWPKTRERSFGYPGLYTWGARLSRGSWVQFPLYTCIENPGILSLLVASG